ncbi:hypothetical protein TRIATDRAFT_303121 [Trichoderma atroviride IMI 206040]|uniref:Uncharacterized protein n=1 Tax=Hypocrea atroviridis (strain ATCC 20476 / IMI 206040) TaxID=452589 RepID=G9NDW5_HYPAI|nr:uncharacterized protein TRIATDRAFT_303121 [Trichoderma atroviride IMI 206040]EHK51153.1 hypothetical protein TRIATDRAFT_303121 [Trichoderma atroviride IMI 206040]
MDDNSTLDYVYKRRKIEDTSAQLGADEGTYKKRLRLNDDNDCEHRHKRQKPESPTACITSHASSSSSSSSLQQLEGENVAEDGTVYILGVGSVRQTALSYHLNLGLRSQ